MQMPWGNLAAVSDDGMFEIAVDKYKWSDHFIEWYSLCEGSASGYEPTGDVHEFSMEFGIYPTWLNHLLLSKRRSNSPRDNSCFLYRSGNSAFDDSTLMFGSIRLPYWLYGLLPTFVLGIAFRRLRKQ